MAMEVNAGRFPAETPAMLVIKSPAPEANDIPIDGVQLGWTVRQLKKHLTVVHPSKPKASKQRLIYAGRALQDHQRLSDVLRRFQPGIKQHIHMVVAGPPKPKTPVPSPMTKGLRQRRPPSMGPLDRAGGPEEGWTTATGGAQPRMDAFTTFGGAAAVGTDHQQLQQQLHMLAIAAHQYAQYAQQCAAAGYPENVVAGYVAQAKHYSDWYQHVLRIGGGTTDSTTSAGGTTTPEAPATAAADAQQGGQGGPDDGQFAQAGHGADAGFVDRDEPPPRNQLTLGARILEQVALILKLAFFLMYFGSHVGGWRYAALVLLCIVTLLYQGGWVRRDPAGAGVAAPAAPDNPEPEAEDAGADEAAEAVRDAGTPEAAEAESDERVPHGPIPDPTTEAVLPEVDDEGGVRPAVPPTVASEEPHRAVRPPRPIARVVGNIVYTFFASLVPGMLERPGEID